MNRAETGGLLALCVAFDRRTVGDADILAWHEVLNDLPFEDCKAAVMDHFRSSKEWLMPADIRATVGRLRAARLAHPDAVPDADPDDVPGYIAALRQGRHRAADGGPTRALPPLEAITRRIPPTDRFTRGA